MIHISPRQHLKTEKSTRVYVHCAKQYRQKLWFVQVNEKESVMRMLRKRLQNFVGSDIVPYCRSLLAYRRREHDCYLVLIIFPTGKPTKTGASSWPIRWRIQHRVGYPERQRRLQETRSQTPVWKGISNRKHFFLKSGSLTRLPIRVMPLLCTSNVSYKQQRLLCLSIVIYCCEF